jgi:hypothetical protein
MTEVQYEGAGIRAETRISDISLSGVYIDTMSPLPVGARLRLRFVLTKGASISVEGAVVHSEPGIGMGIAFTSLEPEDAKLIEAELDQEA